MAEIVDTLRRTVWNAPQDRLRTPFRIPAAFVLGILAVQLVAAAVRVVTGGFGLGGRFSTLLLLLASTGVAVVLTWFLDRRHLRDVGLDLTGAWRLDLVAGLVVGLGMAAVVVATLRVAGFATIADSYDAAAPDILLGTDGSAILYGFLFFGAVGLLEEFLVRGYLLVNIAEGSRGAVGDDRRAVFLAVVATSGIFGVLHAANPGGTVLSLLNITLAGLLLGSAYALTGRLAFPIGVHITWNFGLGPVFGLPVSGLTVDTALVAVETDGPAVVTGGGFGPEGGLVMLPALAVGAGALAWWVRRRQGALAVDGQIAVPDLWTQNGD